MDGGVLAGRVLGCGSNPALEMRSEETLAVDVSGQHYDRDGEQSPERTEWDLVKRCDQPDKVLIQLESLILAQSERWRQA